MTLENKTMNLCRLTCWSEFYEKLEHNHQRKRMKWSTYHIYRRYWSNAVYKYVDIYNSGFNCRSGGKETQIIDRHFTFRLHTGFFSSPREAKWSWINVTLFWSLWRVTGRAHRSQHLNDETTWVFITKATVIPHIPACFQGCRRRLFTCSASFCKAPRWSRWDFRRFRNQNKNQASIRCVKL